MRNLQLLSALWKANLQSAMEYRAAFLTQVVFMMLNNLAYFMFWVLYFDKFNSVRGWSLQDMMLLFGVAATAWGIAAYFFGNFTTLSEIISLGRLDYYLSLPRPVLLHALASRSLGSGMGDLIYGVGSYFLSGYVSFDGFLRFLVGVAVGVAVFLSFLTLVQSLTFWLGNTTAISQLALNALLTFSLYPRSLFDGAAKFILLTIIPASLIGSMPAEFVKSFSWPVLLELLGSAALLVVFSVWVFERGLKRYESGNSMQAEV
jgi:ABC-2 type transport system permease protein